MLHPYCQNLSLKILIQTEKVVISGNYKICFTFFIVLTFIIFTSRHDSHVYGFVIMPLTKENKTIFLFSH